MELTILMPCLNEAETLEICIKKSLKALEESQIMGEVLIADNGSTDESIEIAERCGAKVVHVKEKGYGSALRGGIEAAEGRYILMGDADDSYNFGDAPVYLSKLHEGFDLVMGNRFKGGIANDAMPFLHFYLGNPVLTFIGQLFFKIPVGDFHCGLRAFSKEAYHKMNLKTTGMEFASEMVVKASLNDLRISEVSTTLKKDGRSRPPHLRTWRDGWRHLRFLLMYAPNWLFLFPGLFLMFIGIVLGIAIIIKPINIKDVVLDINTLLFCSSFVIIGYQMVSFYTFTKIYALTTGYIPKDKKDFWNFNWTSLERGLIIGGVLITGGIILSFKALSGWSDLGFGNLNSSIIQRTVIPAITLIITGFQCFFNSFFRSILKIEHKD